jgi:hypothetical protein
MLLSIWRTPLRSIVEPLDSVIRLISIAIDML